MQTSFLRHIIVLTICVLTSIAPSAAADFFDTSNAGKAFNLGVRIGVNTSNRTVRKGVFSQWNNNGWGTGFDAGAVCNLNFRNYLTIQPGIFFESHSGSFAYITDMTSEASSGNFTQVGHLRSYSITIPVIVQVNFNITDRVRWSVDLGPYANFRLGSGGDKIYLPAIGSTTENPIYASVSERTLNAGIKAGSGIRVAGHYYFGIHYLAAMCSPWKTKGMGGREKAWTFTIGYDF